MSRIREERRADILQAALVEFCQKGLEAASMAEIAKRIGIGKSTIYEYFPSKDKLLEEVCTQLWMRIDGALDQAFSEEKTFRGKLLRYYNTIDSLIEKLGINFTNLFTSEPIKDVLCDCVDNFSSLLLTRFVEAIRIGQENGEVDPSLNRELLAVFLTTQSNPFLLRSVESLGIPNGMEQVADVILRGIAPPKE